jgi:hypothetical protein
VNDFDWRAFLITMGVLYVLRCFIEIAFAWRAYRKAKKP